MDLGEFDLTSTFEAIQEVVRNPQSNLTLTMVLVALVTLLLLGLVLSLLLAVTPRRVIKRKVIRRRAAAEPDDASSPAVREEADDEDGEDDAAPDAEEAESTPSEDAVAPEAKRPSKGRSLTQGLLRILGTPLGIAALMLAGVVGTYLTTSVDAYCAGACHSEVAAVGDAVAIGHARCVACHESPGVLGVPGALAGRTRMAVASLSSPRPTGRALVDSSACLACHDDVSAGTLTSARGIRVSHAEIIEGGDPCTACHAATGHTERVYAEGMSKCVTCHDGTTASAQCDTCHTGDPTALGTASAESTATIGSGEIEYPLVKLDTRDCAGCHDVVHQCDPCHGGVRMPHTRAFIDGGHARESAFEGKQACWKCHDPDPDCAGCHMAMDRTGASGHPDTWKVDHATAPWSSPCACHALRHEDPSQPFCPLCHEGRR